MKNLLMTALYGPNWRDDIATDDETMADGWGGRIILLSVLWPMMFFANLKMKRKWNTLTKN